MSIRGTYHQGRVEELVSKFKVWREERLPGARAFQSTYDRFVHLGYSNPTGKLIPSKCWCDGLQVAFPAPARYKRHVSVRLHPPIDGAYARTTHRDLY